MIRRILIPIRGDGKGENVFAHAAAVARRFNSHIEAAHCRARPEDFMPFGVIVPSFLKDQIAGSTASLAAEEEAKLRPTFRRMAEERGFELVDEAPKGPLPHPTARWFEAQGRQVDVIKRRGRLADLIVVAKPDRDRNLGANTLKSALLNTGRPVLMAPPAETPPAALGDRIAIAWNGSTKSARAVALTLDLIGAAGAVTILTAGEEPHGASAEDLRDYLAQRGVAAELVRLQKERRVAGALMRGARAAEADLLIMGAYGESRERETLFGGTTQDVVDETEAPVVLVH